MDCVIYFDIYFLIGFWTNLLITFLVRKLIKIYRTFYCIFGAFLGAGGSLGILLLYLQTENRSIFLLHIPLLFLCNVVSFGKVSLFWHVLLSFLVGAVMAGIQLAGLSYFAGKHEVLVTGMVSCTAFFVCCALERQSRVRWRQEHMKAKTVLEFEERKMFATALIDTGNRLYDPFYHKPVILVNERLMQEILLWCKQKYPERLQYIPYSSVGRSQGMLEGVMFDRVSIQWQNKKMQFHKVIAASTKETLYKGREYQVIFHCGLLEEP